MDIKCLRIVLERAGHKLVSEHRWKNHQLVYSLFHNGVFEGHYTKREIEYVFCSEEREEE